MGTPSKSFQLHFPSGLFLLSGLGFALCLLLNWMPMIVASNVSEHYVYVNAWDEETYLTLQVAEQVRTTPGYLLLNINYVLLRFGLSGAYQNVLFDTVILVAIAISVWHIFRKIGVSKVISFALLPIILFSSVLVNYTNPYIKDWMGLPRAYQMIVSGWEGNASIMRTPEPQLSYLLISLCAILYFRYKKAWLLLIPLPFVYFFVGVGYFMFLSCLMLNHWATKNDQLKWSFLRLIASPVATYLFLASFALFALHILQIYVPQSYEVMSSQLIYSRNLFVPIHGLLALLMCIVCLIQIGTGNALQCRFFRLATQITILIFLLANIQLIAGFTISPKNYFDYTLPIMMGAAVSLYFISLSRNGALITAALLCASLSCIIVQLVFSSVGCSVENRQCRFFIGYQLGKDQVEKYRQNPLGTISSVRGVTEKLSYSHAELFIPPLSYQYSFTAYDPKLLEEAVKAAREFYGENSAKYREIKKTQERIIRNKSYLLGRGEIELLSLKPPGFDFIDPIKGPVYIIQF